MVARPVLGGLGLLVLAGGILLQFLVILSGTTEASPENQIYFLQASTNGVSPSTRNPSRWTFFAVCGVDSAGHNTNCGAVVPALPFDPPRNFGTQDGVPDQFIGTHHYYYLSRFMFAFYLIALFFSVIALFTGLLALCSRLGGYISGFNTTLACFFQALTASLMTAWTVQGRNAFHSNGQNAKLGVKAYAFTWTAFACFLISTVLFCVGGSAGKESVSTKRSMFGRKRSTRSRGSFIDTESQRRVKAGDDYST
ncbi:SUR7-domain-containing protein [Saccharata proteae CBS 121410]|uniref:SUR7-domain-containing protein n=1 Tax=Saccharata proteae CBS 121410 TaxID=1314787 RepID=A0A9P4HWD5_9PEZI|nr:SUR7-domain-containing protein [Saccharata proteae CBS 121410]